MMLTPEVFLAILAIVHLWIAAKALAALVICYVYQAVPDRELTEAQTKATKRFFLLALLPGWSFAAWGTPNEAAAMACLETMVDQLDDLEE